jgi:hypothetical protein
MKKIKLSVAALLIAGSSFAQTQCTAITKQNNQCKNVVKNGNLCYLHNPNYVKEEVVESTQCSGTSKSTNKRCKRNTKHLSGFCHNHRNTN